DVDAGALHAVTQFTLLAVLVVADRATREAAYTQAHERSLATFGGVIAAQQACRHARQRTDQRTLLGLAHAAGLVVTLLPLLRLAIGIVVATTGGAARQHRGGDGRSDRKT